MNRDLLIKLRDVIEDIKKLPQYISRAEAEAASNPGVYLGAFTCGQTYCVLGWAVQRPEFAPFIVRNPVFNSIVWFETIGTVSEAIGLSFGTGCELFGSTATLDERLNLIQELLNENK